MIRLAWRSARTRPASMLVVVIVGLLAPILLSTAASLLATAIGQAAPPRTFTAPVVVAGPAGFPLPDQQRQRVAYPEGSVVPDGLAATVRADEDVSEVEVYRSSTGTALALGAWPRRGLATEELATKLHNSLGDDIQVLTGDERGLAEDPGIRASRIPLVVVGAVTSGTMIAIVVLVASAALSLTINERRREIRVLQLVGATPRQIRRLLVVETTLVAALAATLGTLGSPFVSSHVLDRMTTTGLLPPLLVPTGHWLTAVGAGLLTVLCLSASAATIAGPAVRRAANPDQPTVDARPPSPVRRSLALAVGATSAAMLAATPFLGREGGSSVGGPAVLVAATGVGLGAPFLIHLGLPALRRGGSGVGFGPLGVDEISARAGRFGSVLAMLALGVALAAANISAAFTTVDAERPRTIDAASFIDVDGAADPETIRAVAAAVGENVAVSPTASSVGWIEAPYDGTGSDPLPLLGINHAATFVIPEVEAGSLDALTGSSIAISRDDAEGLHIGVGDHVDFRFGDGTAQPLRVVALLDAERSDEVRIVPFDLLAKHVRTPTSKLVVGTGTPTADLASDLSRLGIEARVTEAPDRLSGPMEDLGALIYLAVGLAALTFATLVALNTMVALTLSRRAELWSWRLVGATRRQLLTAVLLESTYVGLISLLVGGTIGAASATMIALGLGRSPSLPPWGLAVLLVMPAVLVVAAAALAGLRATRSPEAP